MFLHELLIIIKSTRLARHLAVDNGWSQRSPTSTEPIGQRDRLCHQKLQSAINDESLLVKSMLRESREKLKELESRDALLTLRAPTSNNWPEPDLGTRSIVRPSPNDFERELKLHVTDYQKCSLETR
jgi:hypothetical protein